MSNEEASWDSGFLNKVLDFYRSLISIAILLTFVSIAFAIGLAVLTLILSFRSEAYGVRYPELEPPTPQEIESIPDTELRYNPIQFMNQSVGGITWQDFGNRIDAVSAQLGLTDYDKRLLWAYLAQDIEQYVDNGVNDDMFLGSIDSWSSHRLRNPGRPLALRQVLSKIETAYVDRIQKLEKQRLDWDGARQVHESQVRMANQSNRQAAIDAIMFAGAGFIFIAMLVLSVLLFKIEMNTR